MMMILMILDNNICGNDEKKKKGEIVESMYLHEYLRNKVYVTLPCLSFAFMISIRSSKEEYIMFLFYSRSM